MSSELLTPFPEAHAGSEPRGAARWYFSLGVHLPLVLLLVWMMFRVPPPPPEKPIKPDLEFQLDKQPPRPAPRVATSQPKPMQERPLLGWHSDVGDKNALRQPPLPKGPAVEPEKTDPTAQQGRRDVEDSKRTDSGDQAQTAREESVERQGAVELERPKDGTISVGRPGLPRRDQDDLPPSLPPRRGVDAGRGRSPNFNVGVSGGLDGALKWDDNDYPWDDYASKVYFAIRKAWLRELDSRVRRFERDQQLRQLELIEGTVAIHFVIHRDGTISEIEIVDPSVLPTLDEASVAALRRVVLPPLPEDFPRPHEGATFAFMLIGFSSVAQLQQQLDISHERGEF